MILFIIQTRLNEKVKWQDSYAGEDKGEVIKVLHMFREQAGESLEGMSAMQGKRWRIIKRETKSIDSELKINVSKPEEQN